MVHGAMRHVLPHTWRLSVSCRVLGRDPPSQSPGLWLRTCQCPILSLKTRAVSDTASDLSDTASDLPVAEPRAFASDLPVPDTVSQDPGRIRYGLGPV
jgi:hypothetical protein